MKEFKGVIKYKLDKRDNKVDFTFKHYGGKKWCQAWCKLDIDLARQLLNILYKSAMETAKWQPLEKEVKVVGGNKNVS